MKLCYTLHYHSVMFEGEMSSPTMSAMSQVLTLPQSFASPNLRADLPVCRLGDERREPYPFPSSNAG